MSHIGQYGGEIGRIQTKTGNRDIAALDVCYCKPEAANARDTPNIEIIRE
jgi:hypothetical protein